MRRNFSCTDSVRRIQCAGHTNYIRRIQTFYTVYLKKSFILRFLIHICVLMYVNLATRYNISSPAVLLFADYMK